MGKRMDLVGQKFSRLTVVEFSHTDKRQKTNWVCQCECGNKNIATTGDLRAGKVKSCGCPNHFVAIKGGIALIAIGNGWTTVIDRRDLEKIKRFTLYARTDQRGKTYARVRKGNKFETGLQRVLMNVTDGRVEVDHINGNPLDNRRCNLRVCTKSENGMNRGRPVNNTSGYKGVTWNKEIGKWAARISYRRKYKHLGYFKTKEEAARAYNEAAKKYHGDFAYQNKIL